MMKKGLKPVRRFLKKLLLLNGTPHGIALGFALGLFLSVIPTFALGMIIALALAPILKANVVATYLGTAVVNPFTAVFFYGLDYFVGRLIVGGETSIALPRTFSQLCDTTGTIALPLYLGAVLVAGALSLASYGILIQGVKYYQRREAILSNQ